MKAIEVHIIIGGIRALKDGSLGVSFGTPELSPEEKAEFMRLQGVNLIAEFLPLDEKDAPKYIIDKEIEQKTPGNRLRNTLYVLWQQEGGKEEFDDFYKKYMEKFINAIKERLD